MSDAQKLNVMDLYNSIRSFDDFLKTTVKITSGMIDRSIKKGDHRELIQNQGCTIEVEIVNTAPIEADYPLIVFTGVGLGVQFPKTMKRTIARMRTELNFQVDFTNAPQDNPFPANEIKRIDTEDFPPFSEDEEEIGYILFPGKTIRYKFSITGDECPDIKQVKLCTEGTVSQRHLFHQSKEIPITIENIVYKL